MSNAKILESHASRTEMANMHDQQAQMGEAEAFDLTQDVRQKLFAVGMNVLVISYLFVAMYWAAQDQENLTPVFFKVFFALLTPTMIIFFILKRRLFGKRSK